jgi:sarcosine oxidase subunit delta
MQDNVAGVAREWWMHGPSMYWFIAERDTVNDQIIRTYPASELFNRRVDFEDDGQRADPTQGSPS